MGRHFEYRIKKVKERRKIIETGKMSSKPMEKYWEKKMRIVSEMRLLVFQYDSPEQWIVFVVAFYEFSMESKEATAEEERKRRNG